MTIVSTGMRVDSAIADVRLVGDSILLDSLVARARGTLRASGSVDITDLAHPFVRMSATGQNVRVMDQWRGLLDVDGDVVALGPLDALRVTGRGEMKGGYLALKQFRKDLLRVKAPGDLATFAVFDTMARPNDALRVRQELARKRRVAVIADLSLVVDRDNYYRNRPDANTEFFTGNNEVVLARIDQRTSDQWAVGFVRIGDGVAFFRTLAFVPARGSLTFTPHTDASGIVQQVGERLVWEPGRGLFPLQFLTGGTSKAPSVGLESGTLFPIRGRELNSYLTLGRQTTSLLQQSGSSLSGSEGWSGQLSGETGALAHRQQGATALGVVLHDIGTGATKEYGLDAFSVAPADVATELVAGKTGGVRGALVEGGRYLTTDRYIAAQLRFTTGIPGIRMAQKFGTTYRLDVGVEPWFLFRAPEELGITHPTKRSGAFGALLTRMWEF
jgi:TamB, inner membrane protein subunit of TAM complex